MASFRLTAREESMPPAPVPPSTRSAEERPKRVTLEPLARGRVLFSFFSSTMPSPVTSSTRASVSAFQSSRLMPLSG